MKPISHIKQQVEICLGKAGIPLGRLTYVKQGQRENTSFAYDESWLANPDRFKLSPDLELIAAYQQRKAPSQHDSVFHFAIADTEPDAWGRRIISRDHTKRRKEDTRITPLTELDYLLAVDDFNRIGALRLRDKHGNFLRTVEEGKRATPPLVELPRVYDASRAVEKGEETAHDLKYLQGMRTPKSRTQFAPTGSRRPGMSSNCGGELCLTCSSRIQTTTYRISVFFMLKRANGSCRRPLTSIHSRKRNGNPKRGFQQKTVL